MINEYYAGEDVIAEDHGSTDFLNYHHHQQQTSSYQHDSGTDRTY